MQWAGALKLPPVIADVRTWDIGSYEISIFVSK